MAISENPLEDNEDVPVSDSEHIDIHAWRTSKTKAQRAAAKGGKAGNQGRFRPDIRDWLETFLDAYVSVEKGTKGQNKELGDFWFSVIGEFWNRYTVQDARVGMVLDGQGLSDSAVIKKTNNVR